MKMLKQVSVYGKSKKIENLMSRIAKCVRFPSDTFKWTLIYSALDATSLNNFSGDNDEVLQQFIQICTISLSS